MPNPPMFVALDDVELTRDIPLAGSNICASPPDKERPGDGKPHAPGVTCSAASLGKPADRHIDRHTGVAGIAIRIDPAGVDLEREVSVDRAAHGPDRSVGGCDYSSGSSARLEILRGYGDR